MNNEKTGLLIKEARKQKNLTQKQLADKLHITDRAVSKWERGLSAPDISILEPLSEILELTITEIITGERHTYDQVELIHNNDKAFIDYSSEQIQIHKKKGFRRALSLFIAVIMLMPVYKGIFRGDGFTYSCIPAYIKTKAAADAITDCDKDKIDMYISDARDMYEKLSELYDEGVYIDSYETKLSDTHLEDMFMTTETDFYVTYEELTYKFVCTGTIQNNKTAFMYILPSTSSGELPEWISDFEDAICTYFPG